MKYLQKSAIKQGVPVVYSAPQAPVQPWTIHTKQAAGSPVGQGLLNLACCDKISLSEINHDVFSYPISCYGHLGYPLSDTTVSAAVTGRTDASFRGMEGADWLGHKIGICAALVHTAKQYSSGSVATHTHQ